MSEEKMEIEYELTPEEEALIDRALRDAANAENDKVDFDAIHDAILKKARDEGIVVFSKPRAQKADRKKSSAWRLWTGFAAAAAVFVVGLAVIAVLKNGFGFLFENESGSVSEDQPREHTAVVNTKAPHKGNDGPSAITTAKPTESIAVFTPRPTENAQAQPTNSPIPTEYPMKGGWVGYTILNTFTEDPVSAEDLVPEALPEFMLTKCSGTELYATSYYKSDDGEVWSYSCRASELGDTRLGVGAARFTVNSDGSLHFVWRVTETCWLDAEFSGFEFDDAWDILLTLPLCTESVNSTEVAA